MNRRTFQRTLIAAGLASSLRPGSASAATDFQTRQSWKFDGITFDNLFSGARLSDLLRLREGHYLAISRPETRPINPSPWFAFAIDSAQPRTLELSIRVDSQDDHGAPLRAPRPWFSTDGTHFTRISPNQWDTSAIDAKARLDLPAGRSYLSAWKPVSLEHIQSWIDSTGNSSLVRKSVIGYSREGRPLHQLEFGAKESRNLIVVLGGQHPPEITGNLGIEAFVDELLSANDWATRFRQSFRILAIPMINPDGKYHGHWRCTAGGKDPNRDWFDTTEPEIQAVTRHLSQATRDHQVRFAIDFHSTNRDFLYVESPGASTALTSFTHDWFAGIAQLPGGKSTLQEPGRPRIACSREWMSQQWQCPSYTREFRYDQDENEVRRFAQLEARALMELLLKRH